MNPLPASAPIRHAWSTVALLWPVALLNYLDRQVLATLQLAIGADLPMLLDSRNFGRLMGIFLWVYGVMSPLSGLIADRLSRKWLIVGSLAIWSLVTLLMGSATGLQQLFWLRALMGVSEALYIPASLALIADYHQGRTRSLAVGIHGSGIYVGQALGGFGALVADEISWRAAFQMLGLAGVAYSVVLATALREFRTTVTQAETGFRNALGSMRRNLFTLLSFGSFWIIVWYFAAPGAPGWVMKNWLPTLFAKMDFAALRGVLPEMLGRLGDAELASKVAKPLSTIVLAASGFVGVIAGGWIADRWARHHLRGRIYTGAIGLSLTIPALLALTQGHIPAVAIGAAILFGIGFGLFDANGMPILCQFVPPHLRATGYGCMNLVGVFMGALATEIVGGLDQRGGLADAIGWLALPVITAVALILLLRPVTLNRLD